MKFDEDFVLLFTSKFIAYFIDRFTLKMKSQAIAYLLNGSEHIYIGFWTLKVKCTQYGICGELAFKNARAIVFRVGWGGQKFSVGS